MATATSLMTAEQYMALPDSFNGPTELVKGELVTMPARRAETRPNLRSC